MEMIPFLKKLAARIAKRTNSLFECPVDYQRKIINKCRDPKDDLERSYFQYLCQMKLNGFGITLLLNIVSLPLIIYYSIKKSNKIIFKKTEAIFISEGIDENVIPEGLRREFKTWEVINELKENYSKKDKIFFKRLVRRYPCSWHFLLKALIKIRVYSYLIECNKPKAIVVCGEYSFTSSLLTEYCKALNVEHINVMHGEKLFYIRDSFFHYNRCYIWDEFYKKLFIELRAEPSQFVIMVPASLIIETNPVKDYDYTYYLGPETGDSLLRVSKALNILKRKGLSISLRPHPRYSDKDEITRLFQDYTIEDNSTLSIGESLARTKNVISLYSTVLNQAYHSNIPVIIDDISNPEMYKKLSELQYVMLEVQHKLLSSEVGSNNEKIN